MHYAVFGMNQDHFLTPTASVFTYDAESIDDHNLSIYTILLSTAR